MTTQHPDRRVRHESHDHGDMTSIHGMLLFGEETLYFSHLPMFDEPHHFQVIVAVEFDDATREVLTTDRKADTEQIHTFKPESFDITELDPSGPDPVRTSLRGTIYHGHFERGGTPIAEDVVARILHVVHFRTLDREAAHDDDAGLIYLAFGSDGELHLAHYISARPDFDHILRARLLPGTITTDTGDPLPDDTVDKFDLSEPVRFDGRHDTPADRLTASKTVKGLFTGKPTRADLTGYIAQLEIVRDIYLEIDELA
jgi:hypothetical protein